jgi:leucyl aminopeptidase (aminopeptidase T)
MPEEPEITEEPSDDLSEAMLTAARSVVRTCMQIRPSEHVLVVTDPETSEVGRALYEATAEVTDRILLMMMPPSHKKGMEPPSPVADLMRQQDVVLLATKTSLTHTRARRNATRVNARIASMPGITTEILSKGGMTADYGAMKKEISGLNPLLRKRTSVVVRSPGGTDLSFRTGARWVLEDSGICNRPGQITNLPAGKVFVLPKEGTANGKVVIDGSWEGHRLEEPLTLLIEDGVVIGTSGGEESEEITRVMDEARSRVRSSLIERVGTIAEFGFGMNPRSHISGNQLEDQVVRGSAYIAIGDNSALGGTASVGFQLRGVMSKPSVELEDVDLVVDGKITARKR